MRRLAGILQKIDSDLSEYKKLSPMLKDIITNREIELASESKK